MRIINFETIAMYIIYAIQTTSNKIAHTLFDKLRLRYKGGLSTHAQLHTHVSTT